MSTKDKESLVNNARNLSRFFSIDLTIKMFGFTIFEFHYPPKDKEI